MRYFLARVLAWLLGVKLPRRPPKLVQLTPRGVAPGRPVTVVKVRPGLPPRHRAALAQAARQQATQPATRPATAEEVDRMIAAAFAREFPKAREEQRR
jgi:hypothetical protein